MVYEYFAQGVALLRQHGGCSAMQLKQFEGYLGRSFVPTHVENQVRSLVLSLPKQELQPLKEVPTQEQADVDVLEVTQPLPVAVKGSFWGDVFGEDEDAPAVIEELYRRAIMLHKRETMVHAQMGVAARVGDKKQAYELAMEIMEVVRPELDGIYDSVREWRKTGKLAVRQLAVGSPEQGVLELMKRLKYCNERVSRINGWISDGYRVKTVGGEKVKVLLDAKEVQELDSERLDKLLEVKEIKEKLGI